MHNTLLYDFMYILPDKLDILRRTLLSLCFNEISRENIKVGTVVTNGKPVWDWAFL